jgi:hypothetical protein
MAACFVPTTDVPADTAAAAERMHSFARKDLQLEDVVLRWFREETAAEVQERLAWYGLPPEHPPLCFEMAVEEDAGGLPLRLPESGPLNGLYMRHRPNEVWVFAGLSPDDAAHTTAHELHHAWQLRHYPEEHQGARLRDFYEGLSQAYAAHAAKRLSSPEGSLEEASV